MAPCQNYIHVQASTAAMNKKPWHSKCQYKRNSGSVPDPATATTTPAPGDEAASAAASGQVLRQKDSHPPRTRASHSGRETETQGY
jgi:hypothetical protein